VTWTDDDLERIAAAEELEMAPLRPVGTPRRPVPIWVVRVGDDVYVRSWRGTGGSWFRVAQARHEAHVRASGLEKDVVLEDAGGDLNDTVDAAYRAKYGLYTGYVGPMVRSEARATTLRLVPRATT
jgi:hypothetical protein